MCKRCAVWRTNLAIDDKLIEEARLIGKADQAPSFTNGALVVPNIGAQPAEMYLKKQG